MRKLSYSGERGEPRAEIGQGQARIQNSRFKREGAAAFLFSWKILTSERESRSSKREGEPIK
jgi:hypothetical protein